MAIFLFKPMGGTSFSKWCHAIRVKIPSPSGRGARVREPPTARGSFKTVAEVLLPVNTGTSPLANPSPGPLPEGEGALELGKRREKSVGLV
jgi:hypothetical protein